MSIIKANGWHSNNPLKPIYGVPLNIQEVQIPYSAATPSSGGYRLLTDYTTGNTASLYSFTYTPVSSSSVVQWMAFIEGDRSSVNLQESIIFFVNNQPKSISYMYPRNANHEPWQFRCQSGVYINTSTSNITFDIRCSNGGGWTQTLGRSTSNDQILARTVQIIEYQR